MLCRATAIHKHQRNTSKISCTAAETQLNTQETKLLHKIQTYFLNCSYEIWTCWGFFLKRTRWNMKGVLIHLTSQISKWENKGSIPKFLYLQFPSLSNFQMHLSTELISCSISSWGKSRTGGESTLPLQCSRTMNKTKHRNKHRTTSDHRLWKLLFQNEN